MKHWSEDAALLIVAIAIKLGEKKNMKLKRWLIYWLVEMRADEARNRWGRNIYLIKLSCRAKWETNVLMSDASLKIYAIYRDEGEDVVFFIARSFWLLTLKRISELSLIFNQTFSPLCDLLKPYGGARVNGL